MNRYIIWPKSQYCIALRCIALQVHLALVDITFIEFPFCMFYVYVCVGLALVSFINISRSLTLPLYLSMCLCICVHIHIRTFLEWRHRCYHHRLNRLPLLTFKSSIVILKNGKREAKKYISCTFETLNLKCTIEHIDIRNFYTQWNFWKIHAVRIKVVYAGKDDAWRREKHKNEWVLLLLEKDMEKKLTREKENIEMSVHCELHTVGKECNAKMACVLIMLLKNKKGHTF